MTNTGTNIMQELHYNEINSSIASFYDGAWHVRLGDERNGWDAEAVVETYAKAMDWLENKAMQRYPNSVFARSRKR